MISRSTGTIDSIVDWDENSLYLTTTDKPVIGILNRIEVTIDDIPTGETRDVSISFSKKSTLNGLYLDVLDGGSVDSDIGTVETFTVQGPTSGGPSSVSKNFWINVPFHLSVNVSQGIEVTSTGTLSKLHICGTITGRAA